MALAQSVMPLPDDSIVHRSVRIDTGRAQLTGVCLMRANGQTVAGAVLNEFGIKAFDFTADRKSGKVELINVVGFLNKWYIRRTIAADLSYLLTAQVGDKSKKYEITVAAGVITLQNKKRHLVYEFAPLRDDCDDSNNVSDAIRE